jgi:hypothetical protein
MGRRFGTEYASSSEIVVADFEKAFLATGT